MVEIGEREEELLRFHRVGRLSFLAGDGRPIGVPMCPVYSDGVVYMETRKDSWKVKRFRQDPRASFLVDEYSEDWGQLRKVRLDGEVEIIEDGEEYRKAKELLLEKFHQFNTQVRWVDEERVILKVVPDHVATSGF